MRLGIFVALGLVFGNCAASDTDFTNDHDTRRGARKLFGGYRITPRLCKPSKKVIHGGPTVCMFNHECLRRKGNVVGACMDGFLFGTCCELLKGTSVGDLLDEDNIHIVNNDLLTTQFDITTQKIPQTLSNTVILPTAEDNEVVQVNSNQIFQTTGVTHQPELETVLLNENNEIDPSKFKPTVKPSVRTTLKDGLYSNTPIYGISLSNAPIEYTTVSGFNKPMFKPKPDTDKYVLVPTITHDLTKNKTQFQSVVNIVQMLNTTTRKPPSTSYIFSTTVSKRPTIGGATTQKLPSTSYVYSSTVPPRRTESTTKKNTRKTKPTTTKKPGYVYNVVPSKTTLAYSPDAFVTSFKPGYASSSSRPIFSSISSSRPGLSSTIPSAAPTVIVLGPISDEVNSKPYTTSPPRKPQPTHVTINNHITQNIFSSTPVPSPTILITPKPSISSSVRPQEDLEGIEVSAAGTAPVDDVNNFPPVRNPNLNMSSLTGINENDLTTPVFVEDDALNNQVESFVNQIIQGLQEPFNGLRDVVYNRRNVTSLTVGTTTTTTRRPQTVRPNVRPSLTRPTSTTTTTRPSTKRPSTKRPTNPNRKTTVTTKRPKTTRKPVQTTTTQSFIEQETEQGSITDSEDYRTQCGVRPLMKTGRIVGGKGATFGEFPWQVLVRESTWLGLFTKNKCGGVLISRKYVMTAAHCQPGFLASLVAVFGEFDISGDLEKKRPISRNVKRVIVHRQYDPTTFENDLALLELEHPVQFDAHILPICLPRDDEDFTGRLATVTGWGRLKYGGGVPSVLQEVQVPIMENPVCQEMFRTAGHTKVILESFLCAGYANGQKDSCEGDSGGPLVLQRPDGRYQLAGTVSHGIKCAAPYLPGVYMRTQYFKPWITSITGVTSP